MSVQKLQFLVPKYTFYNLQLDFWFVNVTNFDPFVLKIPAAVNRLEKLSTGQLEDTIFYKPFREMPDCINIGKWYVYVLD